MPIEANIFRIFIASTNDLLEERRIVRDVIHEWNTLHGFNSQVYLEPVLYQSHIKYDSTKVAQADINESLVDSCDLMIAIFWKSLGTPTEQAQGGTLEELHHFAQSNRPALICFKKGELSSDDVLKYGDDIRAIHNLELTYTKNLTLTFKSAEELRLPILKQISHFAIEFIKSIRAEQGYSKKGIERVQSDYEIGADVRRLDIQAAYSRRGDLQLLTPAINRLAISRDRPLRALDYGCGTGATTWDRFHNIRDVGTVIGVDVSHEGLTIAEAKCSDDPKFDFLLGDIDVLEDYSNHFDIILLTQVLHHLANPQAYLNTLWSCLRPGGVMLARYADDALKLTHPTSPDLDFVLEVSTQVRGSSDAFFGRQLYGMLRSMVPVPVDIEMLVDTALLASDDKEERSTFFQYNYTWRINYAKKLSREEGGRGPNTEMYRRLDAALSREYSRFVNTDGLFSVSPQILACATKAET